MQRHCLTPDRRGWVCVAAWLGVTLAVASSPSPSFAQQARLSTAQVNVQAGNLTVAGGSFTTAFGDTSGLLVTMSAAVTDATGDGRGWHVDAVGTDGGLIVTRVDLQVAGGLAPTSSGNVTYPVVVPSGGTGVSIADALPNSGMGKFNLTIHAILSNSRTSTSLSVGSGVAASQPMVTKLGTDGGTTPGMTTSGGGSVAVTVPAGLLSAGSTLVFQNQTQAIVSGLPTPSSASFNLGASIFSIAATDSQGNELHSFSPPLTFTITPAPGDLANAGGDFTRIGLAYFDTSANTWQLVSCSVQGSSLLCTLSHLTLFATIVLPAGSTSSSTTTAQAGGAASAGVTTLTASTTGAVKQTIRPNGGSLSGRLLGGQAVEASVGPNTAGALFRQANVATVNILFDPQPALPNASALSLGGGVAAPVAAPFDLKVQPVDSDGNPLALTSETVALNVDITLPVLPVAAGQFSWLQGMYDSSGIFQGYIRPAADFDSATNTVALHPSVGSLAGTLFLPVAITPAWVQNFQPNVHLFSGPTADAVDFGPATDQQFNTFSVVAPQVAQRLFVYNPVSSNYGWIDVAGVGPAGPPDTGRGA
jgi:hypothetical protein